MKQDTKWRLRDIEGKEYIIIDSEKVDMQEELNKTITKQMKEIERLNENNQAMQEEMARTWEKLDKKENIIKEVREYFKNHTLKYDDLMLIKPSDVFEILDKENI